MQWEGTTQHDTQCDVTGRGTWWCDGTEGGLQHINKKVDEKEKHDGGDWDWRGGSKQLYITTKIITFIY